MADPISRQALQAGVNDFWRSFQISAETASTNTDALATADQLEGEAHVFATEHQTQGRGRLNREWLSRAGEAIAMSLVLRPTIDRSRWPWISLLAGLAVRDALADFVDQVGVKWPNDVLVGERKISGILAETQGQVLVVGIGINVNQTQVPFDSATSLHIEIGVETNRTALMIAVLNSFESRYTQLQADFHGLVDDYRHYCVTIGRQVDIHLADTVVSGLATGVDEHGQLQLGVDSYSAGDVVHIRSSSVSD